MAEIVKEIVDETKVAAMEPKFTKEQILKSKKYGDKRDLVNALLVNDSSYTLLEVNSLIDKFMKEGVK